ncbi:MAG: PSD1 and planctomycete cytochrome C domain-containing protein [Planctomycetota bacterium]
MFFRFISTKHWKYEIRFFIQALFSAFSVVLIVTGLGRNSQAAEVSFSREVLPILSDRCLHCHGPDPEHREADLRLDELESATRDRGGYRVIEAGNPEVSELIARIVSEDADLLMPPPDSHRKPLTAEEKQTLRKWIEQGASWGKHWAFTSPKRKHLEREHPAREHPERELPSEFRGNPIDAFVQRKLANSQLKPSAKAPAHTLLRRISFDLTGLPPSSRDVREFEELYSQDPEAAVDNAVDRLMKLPHYGERMAMWWLDAARYSDTDGYQQDATRSNWPWRDWVIGAFNGNMPFDQFTIEQFAGDLMEEATAEQILATCFHRNHMANGEGGRHPEESRVDYVIDRVNTMGAVWLGLTLGCAQCHSHKFDPISHQDYYSFYSFFNSIDEDGKAGGGAKPFMNYKSPYAQRAVEESEELVATRAAVLEEVRKAAESEFELWLQARISMLQQQGFEAWAPVKAESLTTVEGSQLVQGEDGSIRSIGPSPFQDDYRIRFSRPGTITALRLEVLPDPDNTGGKFSRGKSGEFILTDVKLQMSRRGDSQLLDIDLSSAVANVEKKVKGRAYGNVKDTLDDDPRNGWTTDGVTSIAKRVAYFALAEPLELGKDEQLVFVMLHRSTRGDSNIGRFRLAVTDQPGPALRRLEPLPMEQLNKSAVVDADAVPTDLRKQLMEQFLSVHNRYQLAKRNHDWAKDQFSQAKRASGEQRVMVLKQRGEPRKTHILVRGVWDAHGDEVSNASPSSLTEKRLGPDADRLDLARWLVSKDNPLTARVIVNQLWQMCFGAGLVRTPEDFGLQGEMPTHPELLDWLAVEFMESGWDLQHILRLIVTSDTYQQSSHITEKHQELDPENRLLARALRFRLPAWMLRDAALSASGTMNPSIGGPPTYPYQPDGVWNEIFMGRFRYRPSQGAAQYRRTVYAFWRRSAAPTFLFDSSQRRVCEVRPRRTNTPLHALTLLNDLTMLENAKMLSLKAIEQHDDSESRLKFLFHALASRDLTAQELEVFERKLEHFRTDYSEEEETAAAIVAIGQPESETGMAKFEEVAAYMMVASLMLNLDEVMTRE